LLRSINSPLSGFLRKSSFFSLVRGTYTLTVIDIQHHVIDRVMIDVSRRSPVLLPPAAITVATLPFLLTVLTLRPSRFVAALHRKRLSAVIEEHSTSTRRGVIERLMVSAITSGSVIPAESETSAAIAWILIGVTSITCPVPFCLWL